MQVRLARAGMRPISLAVDVTNYLMLELGQPLHAFDRGRLTGAIVVRRAAARASGWRPWTTWSGRWTPSDIADRRRLRADLAWPARWAALATEIVDETRANW